jgi:hypothetical protein
LFDLIENYNPVHRPERTRHQVPGFSINKKISKITVTASDFLEFRLLCFSVAAQHLLYLGIFEACRE